MTLTVDTFISLAMANPLNAEITARLPDLGVAQCMLTAGCLFQAVWNHQANRPADHGVKDYDVFYLDPDLSYEAEDRVIRAAQGLFKDCECRGQEPGAGSLVVWPAFRSALPTVALGPRRRGSLLGGRHLHRFGGGDGRVVCALRVAGCGRGRAAHQPVALGTRVVCAKGP